MTFAEKSIATALPGRVRQIERFDAARKVRKWPIRYQSTGIGTAFLDIFAILLSSIAATFFYHRYLGMYVDLSQAAGLAALVSALFCLTMKAQGLYRPTQLLLVPLQLRMVFATWAIVFLLLSGSVFALKVGNELSRGTSMLFGAMTLISLLANRLLVWKLLTRALIEQRFSGRKIVLINDPEQPDQTLNDTFAATGFEIAGHFNLPHPSIGSALQRRLTSSIVEYIRGTEIEEIVVAADPIRWSELRTFTAELRMLPLPVTFVPVGVNTEMFHRPSRDLGGTTCLELQRGPLSEAEHIAKRFLDIVGAGTFLVLLLPLLLLAAIAIKLDSSGPVLFRQKRLGFNGRTFEIWKFRTMHVMEDGDTVIQARAGDDRITRVGRWFRRTSIDELPQLLNVLNGSMSLVGPRPHALAHDNQFEKLVRNYGYRQRVKPGLTGWAQINGYRGPTPSTDLIERRVELDVWYIENWSVKLDIQILFRTPLEVLRGNNAY